MTYVTKIILCAANPRSRAKLEIERYLTQGFIRNKIVDGRDRLPYSSNLRNLRNLRFQLRALGSKFLSRHKKPTGSIEKNSFHGFRPLGQKCATIESKPSTEPARVGRSRAF